MLSTSEALIDMIYILFSGKMRHPILQADTCFASDVAVPERKAALLFVISRLYEKHDCRIWLCLSREQNNPAQV